MFSWYSDPATFVVFPANAGWKAALQAQWCLYLLYTNLPNKSNGNGYIISRHSWLRLTADVSALHSCEAALMVYCGVYTLFIASPAPCPLASVQSDLPLERGRSVSSS